MTLGAFCLLMIGCEVSSGRVYHPYTANPRPETVLILYSPPKVGYSVIADFEAVNTSLNWVQSKAAQLGADAVYVAGFDGSSLATSTDLSNTTKSVGINHKYFCTAVKYNK
jgi:hypothetical protein